MRYLITKIKKVFIKLCFHEEGFSEKAEWYFFATSCGKSSCHGVGATVKHLVINGSLKARHGEYILTPMQLYERATKTQKQYISFIFLQEMSMQAVSNLILMSDTPL